MSKPYDATTKFMVESQPEAWPAYVGLPDAPARIIDADLSTVTTAADKIIRVDSADPYLLHLDFQSGPDADLPRRVLHTNVLLNYRHRLPVQSAAILVRKKADYGDLSGYLEQAHSGETPYLQFRYRVIRVWEQSAEQALSGGLATLPLAPLANGAQNHLPDIIRRMDVRIRQEATPEQARELWVGTYVLMGMEYTPEFSGQLLKGVMGMEDSMTYQYILARGEALGELRGKAEGKAEEARTIILKLGSQRFGVPSANIHAIVGSISSLERLDQLVERLLQVETWDELLA